MKNLIFRLNKLFLINVIFGVCLLILAFTNCFDITFYYEWGPIEISQIFILFFCFLVNLYGYKNQNIDTSVRPLFLCSAYLFLVFTFRELSWGRIFYPTDIPNNFVKMNDLPMLKLFMISVLVFGFFFCGSILMKNYKTLRKLISHSKYYVWYFVYLFVLFIITSVAEGSHNEPIEEMSETAFYLGLLTLSYIYSFNKDDSLKLK